MEQYKGKVAVVTGASAGIGAATVKALAKAGMKVVGLARREDKIKALAKEENNTNIFAFKADMTKEEDIIRAFKWTTDNVGPVHVLINNAGIMAKNTLIDGDTKEWKRTLDTNVLGLTIASREAISIMRKNDINGHIININSQCGHKVSNFPGLNIYEASKYAVTAITETLRLELVRLGSKIKVTSLSPGQVDTEIISANGVFDMELFNAFIKSFEGLQSEDIANGILYVLGTPPHVQVTELTILPTGQP